MQKSIVLTGASAGIGRALAERLAGPHVRILMIARKSAPLDEAAETIRAKGADVTTAMIDVSDREAMASQIAAFDAIAPVDLVIANAGISAGLAPDRAPEADGVSTRLNAVNYLGMLHTIEPLLKPMISRQSGQIVLMSSLAALNPLPDMPSYSATKAAVRAYGTSLRGALRDQGVAVTVICPGFVESAMTARHKGFKPFQISTARAAKIIEAGIDRKRREISFPWQLVALTWLSNRLPAGLADRAVQGFRADILPDD